MEDKSRTRKFRIINVIGNILLLLTVDGENRNIKSIWQERSELNNNRLRISWTNSKDYIPKLCIIARITLTYFLLPGVVGGHGDPQGADPLVDPLGPLVDLDTLAAEILEQVLRLPENTRQLADGLQMSRSILYQYFNTKIGVSGWSVLHPGNPKLMGCVVRLVGNKPSDEETTSLTPSRYANTSLTWLRVVLVTLSSLFSVSGGILVSDILTGVTRWTGKGILTALGSRHSRSGDVWLGINLMFVCQDLTRTCCVHLTDNCSLLCMKCSHFAGPLCLLSANTQNYLLTEL